MMGTNNLKARKMYMFVCLKKKKTGSAICYILVAHAPNSSTYKDFLSSKTSFMIIPVLFLNLS